MPRIDDAMRNATIDSDGRGAVVGRFEADLAVNAAVSEADLRQPNADVRCFARADKVFEHAERMRHGFENGLRVWRQLHEKLAHWTMLGKE